MSERSGAITLQTSKLPPFALIVFGRLGKSAALSLKSIVSLRPPTIYALADQAGEIWLKNNFEPNKDSKLEILTLSDSELKEMGLDNSIDNEYSEYGKERFSKLTAFKWQTIRRVLSEYAEDSCFFSDLDVIWLSSPNVSMLEALDSICVQLQDDSNLQQNRLHFCTGLMYWQKSEKSLNNLDLLFETQKELSKSGSIVNDEQVFNLLRKSTPQIADSAMPLNVQNFVIGHRFFPLLLNRKFVAPIAFHANYVRGEERKHRRLRAFLCRSNGDRLWLRYFLVELALESMQRIFKR
jgi:hypothetical protein